MRVFIISFCCTIAFGFTSKSGLSQDTTIVINEDKLATIDEVFDILRTQTAYTFVYRSDLFKEKDKVQLKKGKVKASSLLKKALSGDEYKYEISEDNIILIKPQITITGKVVDKEGLPMPGVNISIKGTAEGTITNLDGEYKLTTGKDNILIFSFIGYVTQEQPINGRTTIDVVLEEALTHVGEVVITGYQVIDKEKMTGSADAITSDEISNLGINSVEDVLQGAMAGVTFSGSGRPGEDAQIQIRGVNSFSGNTSPLWIVDGMPMMGEVPEISSANQLSSVAATSGIGNIPPDDIESITVLKDAAAAAIYGAQAANGVIVVKTKSGRVGKTYFNVTSNIDITERPSNPIEMMNSAQKIEFERGFYNDYRRYQNLGRASEVFRAMDAGLPREEGELLLEELRNTNTDWFKEIYAPALSQQYSISMNGGSEKTQYYASANYLNEEGIELNNNYDRFIGRIRLTHLPNKKMKIQLGINTTIRNNNEGVSDVNPLRYAIYANPYEKPYNDDGTYADDITYLDADNNYFYGFNIINELKSNVETQRYVSSGFDLSVRYEFLPGLTYTLIGAYNINSNHTRTTIYPGTYTDHKNTWHPDYNKNDYVYSMLDGSLEESTSRGNDYSLRNSIQFIKEFNDHYVSVFAGQELRQTINRGFNTYFPTYDPIHNIGGYLDLSQFEGDDIDLEKFGVVSSKYISKLSSFFLNGTYSYNDRYVFSGSVRYDGSSFVGNKNNFTPLWNASLRWNMHNEQFIKNLGIMSLFAIKVGYGYTGSIDRRAIPWTQLTYSSARLYDGELIPTSAQLASVDLKWQTKEDRNIGFELGFFNNRFELGVNYFHNLTTDILDTRQLPLSSGRNRVTANMGDVVNKGYEFDLAATVIDKQGLRWNVNFNLALLDNEIKEAFYQELEELPYSRDYGYVKGYPVGAWYGYKVHSINPSDGNIYVYDEEGNPFDLYWTTQSRYEIENPPLEYLGDRTPKYAGGVSTSLTYKQFTLRVSGDFKGGHMIESFGVNDPFVDNYNHPTYAADAWSKPGDVTQYVEIDRSWRLIDRYNYDIELEEGDYFRINLLSLGYMVKSDLVNRIGLQSARINFNVRNLHTFTKYKGIDPTLDGAFGYPNTRRYSLSLNIGF